MGGGGQGNKTLLAGGPSDQQQYEDALYQNLMDDVQFGRDNTRLPIPYRANQQGPDFDPKPVPIMQSPAGQDYFDPSYSIKNVPMMAQSGAGINQQQLATILRQLGYA